MKDAIEWDEADILSLIKDKVQESLTLDYKKSDALARTEGKKTELSKDVSAFANSTGGVILYGMEEDKHYPIKIDGVWVHFRFDAGTTSQINFSPEKEVSESIGLFADIGNRSHEPALYYVVTILLDELFKPVSTGGWTPSGTVKTAEGRSLKSFAKNFGIPGSLPVFREMMFTLFEPPIMFTVEANTLQWPDFYLGYDIRAPGFSASKLVRVIQQPKGTLMIVNQEVS